MAQNNDKETIICAIFYAFDSLYYYFYLLIPHFNYKLGSFIIY